MAALYRKYRPATFAEVVGQEHVTVPLSAALDAGRINHAYLFSGPRGCGKTSSARILARSLNCEQGPTSTPCGVCRSCVALGPGGPGNLDVVELDAASHGGVDDTRDLRDRAFYAPAESRYRIFIVDEAHMVTPQGFNALLKIVEEPPEHLVFVFATTEPDKVLATIRSRTHHYPFRLLAPVVMRGLLERICSSENVPVADDVYPLVIRAGGGSPRDSLSIMDQLLAGAGPDGVGYESALGLLGVTDIALIDRAIDALATVDGAALFGAVEAVMDAGHDPRRFAVDLLERLRDLILLQAVPDAAERGLVDAPGDVLDRMRDEAQRIPPATVTRFAELVHTGLGEMRGATAPRLLLEVMCARMLLPSASDAESALLQRLDRLEAGGVSPRAAAIPPSAPSAPAGAVGSVTHAVDDGDQPRFQRPSQRAVHEQAEQEKAAQERAAQEKAAQEKAAQERAAQERAAQEKASQEQAAQEQAAQQRAEQEKAAQEKAAQERAAQERAEQEKAAQEKAEQERAEQERALREQTAREDAVRGAAARDESAPNVDRERTVEPPATAPDPVPAPRVDDGVRAPEFESDSAASDSATDASEVAHEGAVTPAPTPGGDPLARVRAQWQDVRAQVRERSRTVEVMLSGATVVRVDGSQVVLGHDSPPLVKRLAEPRNATVVAAAIAAVFGVDVTVTCVEGGAAPAAAPTAAQPRAKAAPRFSRPSQARAGRGDAAPAAPRGAEPTDRGGPSSPYDDIPPPDGPDLPDDPDLPADPADAPSPRSYETTPEDEAEMFAEAAVPVPVSERLDPDEFAKKNLKDILNAQQIEG